VKIVDDSDDDNSDDGLPEKKVNQKEMTGIIYFMLREIFKDAFEKRNKNKLVGFIHYIVDDMFPKKHLNKDTVRRYMSDFSNNIFDRKFCETVEKALKEFGFNVPKEIKV
jgi:hypothetical protein